MWPRRKGSGNSLDHPSDSGSNNGNAAAIEASERKRKKHDEHYHHHHYHQHTHSKNQGDDDDDDDDDDHPPPLEDRKASTGDEDDDDGVMVEIATPGVAATSSCLHCKSKSKDIQVRCDECQSYICKACHWCHEFQANHEIRVCDRCDAFYCRSCDEMDQCDDCGEVVCASCSTLLSCKFCGGGLCEECATACGRCGIVLCSRDAKFAVDCDTCKLSYCLVCLASGSKDPCVRCGHRPSKRMEQLVHLRLKSIYKAFKQSSRPGGAKISLDPMDVSDDDEDDDPQSLLKAAANAASSVAKKQQKRFSSYHASSSNHHATPSFQFPTTKEAAESFLSNHTTSAAAKEMVDRYMAEKERADAAAEALIAELDEEEEAIKSKKSKKKKKKERQQAKKEEEERLKKEQEEKEAAALLAEQSLLEMVANEEEAQKQSKSKQKKKKKKKTGSQAASTEVQEETTEHFVSPPRKEPPPAASDPKPKVTPVPVSPGGKSHESIARSGSHISSDSVDGDDVERRLLQLVENEDVDGIEDLLFELKGIPGRASIRKNAKKAIKRLKEAYQTPQDAPAPTQPDKVSTSRHEDAPKSQSESVPQVPTKTSGFRTDELLWVVSETSKNLKGPAARQRGAANKMECVMQMSPLVVGWVIGKGGQRIRDLMEESGARVWIDQDNKKADEPRTVYISGQRKPVDLAVRMLTDLVSRTPIAGESSQAGSETTVNVSNKVPQATPVEGAVSDQKTSDKPNAAPVPPLAHTESEAVPSESLSLPVATLQPRSSDMKSEDFKEVVLTCDARFVPLLIGRRGWTIKHIQDNSGAKVDIDQTVSPRQIKISGVPSKVELATKYVQDVLSYPQTQLQGTGDLEMSEAIEDTQRKLMDKMASKATTLAQGSPPPPAGMNADSGDHNSPPSSLIMAHDAKSMISACSSLSTTPEPSISSSSKLLNPHLHTGPLIPPEHHAPVSLPPSIPLGPPRQPNESGFANPMGHQSAQLFRGPGGNRAVANTGRMPNVPQTSLLGAGQGQPGHVIPQGPPGSHFNAGAIPSPKTHNQMNFSDALGHALQQDPVSAHSGIPGLLPPQPVHYGNDYRNHSSTAHQHARSDFGQSPLFGGYPPTAGAASQHPSTLGNEIGQQRSPFGVPSAPGGSTPGSWSGHTTGQALTAQEKRTDRQPLYNMNLTQTGNLNQTTSGLNLGLGFGQDKIPENNAFESPGREESRIVDSLFGPSSGGSEQVNPQSLLPGLQGLSIGDSGNLQSDMWGNQGASSWEPAPASDPEKHVGSLLDEISGIGSQVEGLPGFPPESRFGFGTNNESIHHG